MQPTTTQEAQPGQAVESTLPTALSLAHQLARRGGDVELQGTVLHRDRALTLAASAALAAVVIMTGQLMPLPGVLLLLAILVSLVEDLDGGSGWLRRLIVLRDIGHNVILWRAERLPAPPEAPPPLDRPPWLSPGAIQHRPTLLVCVPADGSAERPGDRAAHLTVLAVIGLGILGVGISATLATISAASLALLSALLTLRHLQSPPLLLPSPAIPDTLALLDAIDNSPPGSLALVVAFIEGGGGHHDGVEVLLQNFAPVLPRHLTRVLTLLPQDGPLCIQQTEGVIQRRGADELTLRAAEGLPQRSGVSDTARVLRLGWRGATLRGDLSDTATILKIIRRLDQAAGAGKW
jgi:hypothetical protein